MDDRLKQYVEALIGAAEVDGDGEIRFERPLGEQRYVVPYSGFYWQVGTENKALVRSRSLWDQELSIDYTVALDDVRISVQPGPDGQVLRLLERDVFFPEAADPFHFVVTGNLDEVNAQIASFNKALFTAMGLLGLGLLGVVGFQITYGLQPLKRLRRAVQDIRSANAQRVPEDLPPEVMALVGEMNALLEQNEKTVDRAKTQAGNLAHALKTPLSILTNEAQLTQTSLSETVDKQVQLMRRHIDHNLARARAATHYGRAHMTADIEAAVQTILRVVGKLYRETQFEFTTDLVPGTVVFSGPQDLEEILGNLIENAAKFGNRQVHVSLTPVATAQGGFIELCIEDDGPGIAPHERDDIFARGKRLDETVPGTGLGLNIVTDLLDVHGGAIALDSSPTLGGLKVSVRFRQAET
ncbi:MAG: HAMP domain-containing sensor histidine kinase [Pseudomonadota bacterium]